MPFSQKEQWNTRIRPVIQHVGFIIFAARENAHHGETEAHQSVCQ